MMAGMLKTRYINTFTSEDVFGAEIAAVLKNVYAGRASAADSTTATTSKRFCPAPEDEALIDTMEIPRNVQTSTSATCW